MADEIAQYIKYFLLKYTSLSFTRKKKPKIIKDVLIILLIGLKKFINKEKKDNNIKANTNWIEKDLILWPLLNKYP